MVIHYFDPKTPIMLSHSSPVRLTLETLQEVQDRGYKYVLIKDYDVDIHLGYLALKSFTLVPVRELPTAQEFKEIFEPVESEILLSWAQSIDGQLDVFIQLTALSD
jgi:hypothetical protein